MSDGYLRGPVTIVDHEGEEHRVNATIVIEEGRWSGLLQGPAPWWDMYNAREIYTLIDGQGRETKFVVQHQAREHGPVQVLGITPLER